LANQAENINGVYRIALQRFNPLTSVEEAKLACEINEGSLDARNRLVNANLRFVVSVAKKYCNKGVSLEDLISAGNMGLLKAAEKFDESRKIRFISYAVWWIRFYIREAIIHQNRIVRQPGNRIDELKKISNFIEEYQQTAGESPTPDCIAEKLGMKVKRILELQKSAHSVLSLDRQIDEKTTTLMDVVPDIRANQPDLDVSQEDSSAKLETLLCSLDSREADIIRLYFGLIGEGVSLQVIGKKFNLTREGVRQIKNKALIKLRARTKNKRLSLTDFSVTEFFEEI